MRDKISKLVKEVIKHDKLYEQGKPIITDSEYDRLYNLLLQLEKDNPDLVLDSTPTKRIYTVLLDELERVRHENELLSLSKVNDADGILHFLNRFDDDAVISVGVKEDGLAVRLRYEDGVLVQAATRGDGSVGEDITHSIRLLESVPNLIDYQGTLEVRGEAIIPFEDFERVNQDGKYRSPRNLVSGTVRTLEADIARDRGVVVRVFDILNVDDVEHLTEDESLGMLRDLGFELSRYESFSNRDKDKIVEYCEAYQNEKRHNLGYMIDGLVLKVQDYGERRRLGNTSKYPRWAIAYKFDSLDVTTKIMGVEWTVGKTGQVTPNAVLEPVEIDNVLVSRASLANYANICKRDIRVGDRVIVTRANDVIPQVVGALSELRTGEEKVINLEDRCPECASVLVKEISKGNDGAVTLYCVAVDCRGKILGVLENFTSRKAMDIDGLGTKTLEIFLSEGIISDIPSLYRLKNRYQDILNLDGFGEKSYQRIVSGLNESKKQNLSRVLVGLGIRNIGENVSQILTQEYKSWDELKDATDDGSLEIFLGKTKGIGDVLKKSILTAFNDKRVRSILNELKSLGCSLVENSLDRGYEGNRLLEGTFVLTGKMYESRTKIQKEIESFGGKVVGNVSGNTSYLVLGGYDDRTEKFRGRKSSKHRRAEELGVKIISDKQLRKMMGEV